ncbi:MAG: nuclear transport factor 2 family protein [Flavobacteriales bacterium]|nr:nuclear transport factor 2 family protein [Flavobacteriales bacterium]
MLVFFAHLFSACNTQPAPKTGLEETEAGFNESAAVLDVMRKHLDAVTHRDTNELKSTLSPDGNMCLILPGEEVILSVDSFMSFHKKWFADTTWTFETRIIDAIVGPKLTSVVTEIMYREPERNGMPYYNRMTVTYVLQKIDGAWYVVQDHASSIEKSTDKVSKET